MSTRQPSRGVALNLYPTRNLRSRSVALKPLRLLSRMREKAIVQRVVVDDSSPSGVVLVLKSMAEWACGWPKRFGVSRLSDMEVGSVGKAKRSQSRVESNGFKRSKERRGIGC